MRKEAAMRAAAVVVALLLTATSLTPTAISAGPSVAAEMLDAANDAYRARDWDEAAKAYRALSEENPYNGEYFHRLANALYNLKQYEASAEAYARAVELGHQVGVSLYNMGCDYALLGEKEKAIDAIERAILNGLQNREQLLRDDSDLESIRDTKSFRERILPKLDDNISREDGWRADLAYLTRRMEETHWDVYANISAEEWERSIRHISKNVSKMEDYEIIVALTRR
jgi:tetratricopeptide (TPR) repeat protein